MHDMLVNKVMPEWRKLRDPANFLSKADDWPEIEIEQDTYITPGNAIASKERWKIAGRWAKIGRKSHVNTIGTKRVLDFSQPWLYWSCDRLPPEHIEGIPDLVTARWRDWYQRHAGCTYGQSISGSGVEAVRCGGLVPSVPTPNPTPEVPGLPNWPKWMSASEGAVDPNDGEGIEPQSERLDDLREQADIAEGI